MRDDLANAEFRWRKRGLFRRRRRPWLSMLLILLLLGLAAGAWFRFGGTFPF